MCAPVVSRLVACGALHTWIAWHLLRMALGNLLFGTPTDARYMQKSKPKSRSTPRDKSDHMITHVSVATSPNPGPQTPIPKLSKSFTCCKYDVLNALTLKTKPNDNKTKGERERARHQTKEMTFDVFVSVRPLSLDCLLLMVRDSGTPLLAHKTIVNLPYALSGIILMLSSFRFFSPISSSWGPDRTVQSHHHDNSKREKNVA